MQIVTVNNISMKDKKIKYENLHQTVINKLMYAFNIINNPDKSILHLQYKKIIPPMIIFKLILPITIHKIPTI
jgi:hypothetical protein